jgi:hypothetical protein
MSVNDKYANFTRLSLKDLVDARNQFHAHLINKKNVVATAVGRYLIRLSDIDDQGRIIITDPKKAKAKEARTIENSVVIDSSWPCILVFVSKWMKDSQLINNPETTDLIPKTIYMPDGRMIPICVVEAPKSQTSTIDVDVDDLSFPLNYIGGGFPILIDTQKQQRVATIACVVTNGHTYYALTNLHATGEKGQVISTKMGRELTPIGVSTGDSLGKIDFSKLYPGWSSQNMKVNCDVGLIRINDLNFWKTDILGIREFDEVYDLNTFNLDLGLIAEHMVLKNKIQDSPNGKVLGYGARSGLMKGEIKALFYRHKTIGGVEYVSDFMISGRNGVNLGVSHADSGALWLLENKNRDKKNILQPIALHWGQHEFFSGTSREQYSYSLSTSVSNICRELEVEIVRGWNIDSDYSWGKVGHYTVGNLSISQVKNKKLKTFMKANTTNISFEIGGITRDLDRKDNPDLPSNPADGLLCPLADVPDIIWKQYKPSADGTKGHPWGRKGDENPNHFADADSLTASGDTLFDVCKKPGDLTVEIWKKYYDDVDDNDGEDKTDKTHTAGRGLLCFRVWQIFDYMSKATKEEQFIFGAGVLAHYIGDACQPLHSSYMHDGDPADTKIEDYTAKRTSKRKDGTISHNKGDVYKKQVNPGMGVHVAYEDTMIDNYIDQIIPAIEDALQNNSAAIYTRPQILNGQQAGYAVLDLMRQTQLELPPKTIIETFISAKKDQLDVSEELFKAHKDATVNCLARGILCLSTVWDAAWTKAKGDTKLTDKSKVDPNKLIALYIDPKNLPSRHLDTIKPLLT